MLLPRPLRHAPWLYAVTLKEEPASDVVRVKVVLTEVVPPTWRLLQVPVRMTLRRFHTIIQEVIGWKGVPLHRFRVGNVFFGRPSDFADPLKDSRWVTIEDIIQAGKRVFTYQCGPNGGWTYEIRIEASERGDLANQHPVCLDGRRACPPEDSGGPDDYVDRTLKLPGFDPEHFDLAEVNAALSRLPPVRRRN